MIVPGYIESPWNARAYRNLGRQPSEVETPFTKNLTELRRLHRLYKEDVLKGNALPPEAAQRAREEFLAHCGAFKEPVKFFTDQPVTHGLDDIDYIRSEARMNEMFKEEQAKKTNFRSLPDRYEVSKKDTNILLTDLIARSTDNDIDNRRDLRKASDQCARDLYNNAIGTIVENVDLELEDELKIAQVLNDVIELTARSAVELYEIAVDVGLGQDQYSISDIITDEFIAVGKEVDAKLNSLWETVNT